MDPREARRVEALTQRLCAMTRCAPNLVHVVRSPLRICPLGAHVDHQLGRVTGFALDQALLLAYVPDPGGRVRLASDDFPGEVSFDLEAIEPAQPGDWGNYPRGAAQVLRETFGITRGLTGVLGGPMPIGGLSSSAAVDVAYLLALQQANGLSVEPADNVRLAQRIENDYIGLHNGVLDQSMILLSRRGALTCLDCLDGGVTHIPNPMGRRFDLLVVFSGISRSLVGTDYNRRVAECGEAARLLLARAGLPADDASRLRHVPREAAEVDALPEPLARRARHFFGEMDRVEAGAQAWAAGDLESFGRLMRESGESSIANYECGSPHLVTLHATLNAIPGVWGARFCGAGFGGSAVALAHPDARERIVAVVNRTYPKEHPDVKSSFSLHFVATTDAAEVLR
ncbi:MAG: hypothetical protein HZB16_01890 [Armatimonadetes bacterium]|nr:hypothetical protein [Armatimonadota bacterium]